MARKALNPKTWYFVGAGVVAGAAALTADGVRRLRRRRLAAATPRVAQTEPAKVQTTATTTPRKKPAVAAGQDDLTRIKGIGPTFAKRLAEAGITTFAGLANASPERLREVTRATAVANPDEWIAQARDL